MTEPSNILKTLEDLQRRIENLERFPQPPAVLVSNPATSVFALEAAGDAGGGDMVLSYFTLHNEKNQWVFAVPELTIFNAGIGSPDLRWPSGGTWTAAQVRGLDISVFCTGDSPYRTHDEDAICYVFLRNRTASRFDEITIELFWRYQQLPGA